MIIEAFGGLLRRIERVAPSHTQQPVPMEESVPAHRVAIVCVGIAFTLTGLYMGSEIALELGWRRGVMAAVVGSIILAVMSIPAAIVGARTRLSTYMIVRHVFGEAGSRIVNAVLALVLIGWYAVTAELFGRTCYLTLHQYFPHSPIPMGVFTVGCSLLVVATTVFGFRALERLSLVVAPMLVALTLYIALQAVVRVPWQTIASSAGTAPDLGRGISAVVGGMIVNVVLMPDLTRYSKSVLDCAVISVTGNGLANGAMVVLAMLPALAFGEIDPMKYMALLGLSLVGFAILVLSTWSVNAVNLYSTGLVTATVLPRFGYGALVIGSGLLATVVALLGLSDRFLDFLVILGLIVPPFAAVYQVDFFILHRKDYGAPAARRGGRTNINALLAAGLGAAVGCGLYAGSVSLTGVPTIESYAVAGLSYWGLERWKSVWR